MRCACLGRMTADAAEEAGAEDQCQWDGGYQQEAEAAGCGVAQVSSAGADEPSREVACAEAA